MAPAPLTELVPSEWESMEPDTKRLLMATARVMSPPKAAEEPEPKTEEELTEPAILMKSKAATAIGPAVAPEEEEVEMLPVVADERVTMEMGLEE